MTPKLSPREQQVVELLRVGNTYKEVAHELGISRCTVITYIKRAQVKRQVSTVAELIAVKTEEMVMA